MRYLYVICPVGTDPWFESKREILKGLAGQVSLDAFFPLERHNSFNLASMKADLGDAEIVLADVSLERPSCYFELGIAEASGAKCFVIAKGGTTIHQVRDRSEVRFFHGLDHYRLLVSDLLRNAVRTQAR